MGDADLAPVITKLRATNPQAIYLNTTTPSSFITVYKKLKEVAAGREFLHLLLT
jgi:hypothetical protein